METVRVDHLGVAVRSLEDAVGRWSLLLGRPASASETVVGQRVRVAFLSAPNGTEIELLEPTDSGSPVQRFLERRGEGLHHVAFSVADVDAALAELRAAGRPVIDAKGRPGSRGRRVGFAHPEAFGGVLVEFVEGGPGDGGHP